MWRCVLGRDTCPVRAGNTTVAVVAGSSLVAGQAQPASSGATDFRVSLRTLAHGRVGVLRVRGSSPSTSVVISSCRDRTDLMVLRNSSSTKELSMAFGLYFQPTGFSTAEYDE